MAKKGKSKKEKNLYPLVPEYKQKQYAEASKDDLVKSLKSIHKSLKKEKKDKAESQALKDAREDLKEFDENWEKNDELIKAKEKYEAIRDQRNDERKSLQDAKTEIESDFNESIKSFAQERECILNEIEKRQ